MHLIYFFGPDGVGKTTQADLLARYLAGKGFRVHRAAVKQHHTLSFLLIKLLMAADVMDQRSMYHGLRPALQSKARTPWKVLEVLSLMPAAVYRVLLPLLLGKIVICDRYVVDSLVSLSYFLGEPSWLHTGTAKAILSLIPPNSLLINLDADTVSLLNRKKHEPLTPRLIEYYRDAYRTLAGRLSNVLTLDTATAGPIDIHRTLCAIVDREFACS